MVILLFLLRHTHDRRLHCMHSADVCYPHSVELHTFTDAMCEFAVMLGAQALWLEHIAGFTD